MVYVSAGGTVGNRSPWKLSSWVDWFWGFLNIIVMFFKTMIGPLTNRQEGQYTRDFRPPGGGPPKPPRRRMGGFADMTTINCPPGAGGG